MLHLFIIFLLPQTLMDGFIFLRMILYGSIREPFWLQLEFQTVVPNYTVLIVHLVSLIVGMFTGVGKAALI